MSTPVKAIIESTVKIPFELLYIQALQEIKKSLTLEKKKSKTFGFPSKDNLDSVAFYSIDAKTINLPRRFGIDLLRSRNIPFEDKRVEGDPLGVIFNEEMQATRPDLKPAQDRVVNQVVEGLLASDGTNSGLLQSATGSGKTVLGIKVACTLGRKTLIVVNSDFLASQWRESFKKFSSIKDEEIGIIQQEHREISDKRIVIGMIQTLTKRKFTSEESRAFGLVIWDEAHKLPAPVFSQTLQKFNAKYLLGLTATPERWDGLDALLQYGLGGKLNKTVLGTQMIPEVYVMHHPTRLSTGSYKYTWGENAGKINYARLINLIAYMVPRNKYIAEMVVAAAKKDRKIMVFSDRLDQLSTLKEWFDQSIPDKSAMFVGGTKDRETAMQAQVMFCTYQYCAEALDVPERDCVFLASPKSKVKQVMGRVLRSQDGKRCPIVVDICDPAVPVLEMFASKRAQEYRTIRAKIHLPSGEVLR